MNGPTEQILNSFEILICLLIQEQIWYFWWKLKISYELLVG